MLMFEEVSWRWLHFDVMTAREWHSLLALRTAVFIVEQDCPYQDPDYKDEHSFHLIARAQGQVIGTLRAVPPGVSYAESSIGRVVIDPAWRGRQMGRALMQRGMAFNTDRWGGSIRISGQAYLRPFYESLGFETVRGPYQEDDIPHFEMLYCDVKK